MPDSSAGATPRMRTIDDLAVANITEDEPGAAIAVIRDGQIVHNAGYGLASVEWGQPVTTDTAFGLGSTTKPFTASAILLLERDSLLSLDAPLTDYLPDYDMHGQTITITHLLTHTSGIPNFITLPGFWELVAPLDHDQAQLRARFEPRPLDFTPGARYSYSNSGYCLLGMVIERVSGMPYQAFIRDRILAPLGMRSSGYLDRGAVVPRLAAPYMLQAGGASYPLPVSPTLVYAAGALYSTVEDMARWDASLRDGTLLDQTALARMQTPLTLNDGSRAGYGLGWGLSTYRGRPVVHHAGGVPGYSAFFARFVEDDLSIIILSNRGLFDSASLLTRPIANLMLNLPTPAPPTTTASAPPDACAGVYTNRISDVVTFTVEDGLLRATGELDATLIQTGPATFHAISDPDITVQFDTETPRGYQRATITVPFYWYQVYRQPDA